jgi:hypothetical protein
LKKFKIAEDKIKARFKPKKEKLEKALRKKMGKYMVRRKHYQPHRV